MYIGFELKKLQKECFKSNFEPVVHYELKKEKSCSFD